MAKGWDDHCACLAEGPDREAAQARMDAMIEVKKTVRCFG